MSAPTGCSGDARAGVAEWLGLAAAPTFATLALLSFAPDWGLSGAAGCGGHADGMTVMYGLMALFHLPAWLRFRPRR